MTFFNAIGKAAICWIAAVLQSVKRAVIATTRRDT